MIAINASASKRRAGPVNVNSSAAADELIANQQVGEPESKRIHGAARSDPPRLQAGPPGVLHRGEEPGTKHLNCHARDRYRDVVLAAIDHAEAHQIAGSEQGRRRSAADQRGSPASDRSVAIRPDSRADRRRSAPLRSPPTLRAPPCAACHVAAWRGEGPVHRGTGSRAGNPADALDTPPSSDSSITSASRQPRVRRNVLEVRTEFAAVADRDLDAVPVD